MEPYKFPHPMDKIYHNPEQGSWDFVEMVGRSIQLEAGNMSDNAIRHLREKLEWVRDCYGWNIWPDPPAGSPKRWIELVLGQPAEAFLDAVRVFSPFEAEQLAWVRDYDQKHEYDAYIRKLRKEGKTQEEIAKAVGRDQSTVSRVMQKPVPTAKTHNHKRTYSEVRLRQGTNPATAAAKIREKFGVEFAGQLKEVL